MPDRLRIAPAGILFLLALVARAGFGLAAAERHTEGGLQFDDERWHWSIAQSCRAGEGMVGEFGHRAERMPVYPWFLSFFAGSSHGLGCARAAQWVLGALAACFTYFLARSLCGPTAGFLAGCIVALDPALVGSASLLLTETLFVTAVAALWWVAWPLRRPEGGSWMRWTSVGLLAALCVHLRESSLLLVAALAVYLIVVRRDRRAVGGVVGIVLISVASLLPWAYRNSRVIGQWCWLTTRGGISLYDGVRPGATGASDLADVKNAPEVAGLSETEWNRYFLRQSARAIADDPLRIIRLAFVKLGRTWSPVLNAAEYQSPLIRLVFAAWYLPFYALIVMGIYARRREASVLIGLLLPTLCLSLIHSFYVGSVRYRLGALPTLAVLAAVGAMLLVNRLRRQRGDSR